MFPFVQRLYQDAGVRVGGFMGSHSPAGGFHNLDVAVCTIEKGNGLVNRLMEENRMDELGQYGFFFFSFFLFMSGVGWCALWCILCVCLCTRVLCMHSLRM